MKPQFTWRSDSTIPHIQSGIARWDFGTPGNFVEMKFPNFLEAHLIDMLLRATHDEGYRVGQRQLAYSIDKVLEEYRE